MLVPLRRVPAAFVRNIANGPLTISQYHDEVDRKLTISSPHWLTFQIAATLIGLSTLYLAPPSRGVVLLVPITPYAELPLARTAVNAGASLIAAGPLPSSQIVLNQHPGFLIAMLKAGIIPLAATSIGCSPDTERR